MMMWVTAFTVICRYQIHKQGGSSIVFLVKAKATVTGEHVDDSLMSELVGQVLGEYVGLATGEYVDGVTGQRRG